MTDTTLGVLVKYILGVVGFLFLSVASAGDLIVASSSVTNADVSEDLRFVAYGGGFKGAWVRGVVNLRFNPDKTKVLAETEAGGIAVIDTSSKKVWDSRQAFNEYCGSHQVGQISPLGTRGVAFAKSGGNLCNSLRIVDLENKKSALLNGVNATAQVLFSKDDRRVVVVDAYSPVVVEFSPEGPVQKILSGYSGDLEGALSPDGETVYVLERFVDTKLDRFSSKVTAHNLKDDSRKVVFETEGMLWNVTLSPNGAALAFQNTRGFESASRGLFVHQLGTTNTFALEKLLKEGLVLKTTFDAASENILLFTNSEGVKIVNVASRKLSNFRPKSFTTRVQVSTDQKYYILQSWNEARLCLTQKPSHCQSLPEIAGEAAEGRLEPIFSSDNRRVLQSVPEGILATKVR